MSILQYYCRRMPKKNICLQTLFSQSVSQSVSSVSSICYDFHYFGADGQNDFHHVGTHRRSELQYYCRRMPKRSLSGGSLDPPEYSKISGLLQRLDSIDGMGPFGPISASEAARAILGGPRGGTKCQNYSITADVCLQEGPNGSQECILLETYAQMELARELNITV